LARTNRIGSTLDPLGKSFRWLIRNVKNELVDLRRILCLIRNVENELLDLSIVPFDGDEFFFSASGLVESKHCLKNKLTNM